MSIHDDVMMATMGEAVAACRGALVDPVALLSRVLHGEREAKDALNALLRLHFDREQEPLHVS